MPDSKDFLSGYIEVKDRIVKFYELYGQGRLETQYELTREPDDKPKVICRSWAYRSPDDAHPATGHSWMYLPGTTNYTRGSELENAETSSVGRAIGFLGILVDKSIASANEIRAKQDDSAPSEGVPIPALAQTRDGSIFGTAEIGKPPSDFELRQTQDEGHTHVISFRLAAGGKSIKVIAYDALAEALVAIRDDIVGVRVQVWGPVRDDTFTPAGTKKKITYPVLTLRQIKTPDLLLPSDEPDLTLTRQAGSSPEPTANPSAPTPVATEEPLGAPEVATGLPSAESDAEELVKPCGAVGSGLGVVCTLPAQHSGKHRELATDGRTLAAW